MVKSWEGQVALVSGAGSARGIGIANCLSENKGPR
jgi:hypothetical protein